MPMDDRVPRKDELFELIVESSRDFAIFTVDQNGITTSWNIGAERLFGYSEQQMIGQSSDVVFTPEDRIAGVPQRERRDALAKGNALDDRWHQRLDGSRFWASGLLMPLKNHSHGFLKIARDRTEQHEADVRLQENEERFRLLATSVPQLVFRTLPDGTRTWGSPQWIAFTGLSLDKSLGSGWLDAIHPEDRAATRRAWTEAQKSGEYYVEHRIRNGSTGEYRWHQTRARPVQSSAAPVGDWVGSATDIHDLKSLHGRQQVMMAELHHRTRNLLTVVQSIAMQMARSSQSVDDFIEKFSSRLGALSRAQSLIARAEREEVDLRTLVETELTAHSTQLDPAKVVVTGPAVVLPVLAAQTLALAVHELTTNAVKYGALAQASGKLHVQWDIDREGSPPLVRLQWIESGVELPFSEAPARRGYGSMLIERALPLQLQAETELTFEPDGLKCTIDVPIGDGSKGANHFH
jgi:PAS domain S-box-containing protein